VPGRDLDGVGQAGAGEHVEADDLFLGVDERAVGDQHLPVAHADRPGRAGRRQPTARMLSWIHDARGHDDDAGVRPGALTAVLI
jgi:hypothetical protein